MRRRAYVGIAKRRWRRGLRGHRGVLCGTHKLRLDLRERGGGRYRPQTARRRRAGRMHLLMLVRRSSLARLCRTHSSVPKALAISGSVPNTFDELPNVLVDTGMARLNALVAAGALPDALVGAAEPNVLVVAGVLLNALVVAGAASNASPPECSRPLNAPDTGLIRLAER